MNKPQIFPIPKGIEQNKLEVPLTIQKKVDRRQDEPVFFAAGFRPFFLFAALQAALMLPLWLAVWSGWLESSLHWPAMVWHSHEMVFGFAGAAVGGFLLTAVPNWTGTEPVGGRPLITLFVVWLAGRVAFTLAGWLPPVLVAAVELAYLPLLAVLLAGPLLRARAWHNIAFLPILAVLWLCDLTVLMGNTLVGLHAGIGVLLVMIAVVAGRIVPSFTRNWLVLNGRPAGVRLYAWIERGGAAGAVVVAAGAWVVAPTSTITGILLLAAAVLHLVRLAGWRSLDTRSEPLLWVLHLGYLWLVVGLALLGISTFSPLLPTPAALHALTAGCVATMILGVMSRAALGHSGRPLTPARLTVAAYLLVSLGAVMRVAAPLTPVPVVLTLIGGSAWTLAWVLFAIVYWPILTRPRIDGRPG
ncbi:NnrS family protein [Gammaproteobacteria bacterium]